MAAARAEGGSPMSAIHGGGRLTNEDRKRIHDLADAGRKAPTIAREINRNASTVHWYMLTAGLAKPTSTANRPKTYTRNGRTIHLFSPEEDIFIEALRIQDYTFERIAEIANKRFGTTRSAQSIKVRLIMLAARDDAE
jgi:hypothetical protein